MKELLDYEAIELARREEQQKAVKAEEKREGRLKAIAIIGQLVVTVITGWLMISYGSWLEFDRFTPPTELLTESEFRELVDGFPLLAEEFGGRYSENMESLTRAAMEYELDRDADGVMDVQVSFDLYGKYERMGAHHNVQTGEVTPHNTLREPQELEYSGWRQHYGLEDLFKGRALATKEDAIYISDHTASFGVTVQNPSKDFAEARAEIDKLLAIVREGGVE